MLVHRVHLLPAGRCHGDHPSSAPLSKGRAKPVEAGIPQMNRHF
jgi:hypothetical protein